MLRTYPNGGAMSSIPKLFLLPILLLALSPVPFAFAVATTEVDTLEHETSGNATTGLPLISNAVQPELVATVPEPTVLGLLAIGLLVVVIVKARRKRSPPEDETSDARRPDKKNEPERTPSA